MTAFRLADDIVLNVSNDLHFRRSSEGSFIPSASSNEGLDSTKGKEKTSIEENRSMAPPFFRRKTLIVSRGEFFPSLTVVGGKDLNKKEIKQTARRTILIQFGFAFLAEIMHVSIFGGFFASMEGWNFLEGIYFAVTSLLTIGKIKSKVLI